MQKLGLWEINTMSGGSLFKGDEKGSQIHFDLASKPRLILSPSPSPSLPLSFKFGHWGGRAELTKFLSFWHLSTTGHLSCFTTQVFPTSPHHLPNAQDHSAHAVGSDQSLTDIPDIWESRLWVSLFPWGSKSSLTWEAFPDDSPALPSNSQPISLIIGLALGKNEMWNW